MDGNDQILEGCEGNIHNGIHQWTRLPSKMVDATCLEVFQLMPVAICLGFWSHGFLGSELDDFGDPKSPTLPSHDSVRTFQIIKGHQMISKAQPQLMIFYESEFLKGKEHHTLSNSIRRTEPSSKHFD